MGKEDYISDIAGKFTIHEKTNKNGKMLCNLAALNDLIISSTKFKHQREHKETWKIPGTQRGNQIDHVLTKKNRSASITDVRSYRGANADTDHYLVICNLKQKINRIKQVERNKKWNLQKLTIHKNVKKYQDKIKQELERVTKNIEDSPEQIWTYTKNTIHKIAEQELGYQKKESKKEWYDSECKEVSEQKKEARIKWLKSNTEDDLQIYREKRKQGCRLFKKKKEEWINNIMEEMEQESRRNNTKKFYKKLRDQNRRNAIRRRGIKNNDGRVEDDSEKIKNLWMEHFQKILNIEEYEAQATDITNIQEEEEVEEPDEDKIKEIIKKPKKWEDTRVGRNKQ